MPSIDHIDFIDLYKWLWNRHEDQKLAYSHFCASVDTYYGLTYKNMPKDDINYNVVKTLYDLGLVENCPPWVHRNGGRDLRLVRRNELIPPST